MAIGDLSAWWVYLIGPVISAVMAVGVAYVLHGSAKVQEAITFRGRFLKLQVGLCILAAWRRFMGERRVDVFVGGCHDTCSHGRNRRASRGDGRTSYRARRSRLR
jgi:hypothetical protein